MKSILLIALTAATSTAAWSFAILGAPLPRGVEPPPPPPRERGSARATYLPALTFPDDAPPDVPLVETRVEAPSVCAFEFHGRVVDSCGRAVEHFAINAIHRDANNRFLEKLEWPLELHTGGKFELRALDPGYWDFAPSAPGLALDRIRSFRASTPSPIDFVLRGPSTVRGIVLDPDRRPVGSAELQPVRSIVDSDGTFEIALPSEAVRLSAAARGFADSDFVLVEPCGSTDRVELVLHRL